MIRVKRYNRVLSIDEKHKDIYLRKGFNVIDEKGKIIEFADRSEIDQLAEAKKEITQLKKELAEAKKEKPKQ